jgi:ABC-type uncharacterized transport system auxiliary subunit
VTRLAWVAPFLLLGACVFRETPEPRFFRPEASTLDPGSEATPSVAATPLRIRSVTAIPLLRERMVWRSSPVEYGLYEQWRWSELPASYVERALGTALRRTPGLSLTNDLAAPALRIEVTAFDEVVGPAPVARVELIATLSDQKQRRVLDRSFSAEAPIAGAVPAATAEAMGKALDQVVAEVASAVSAALRAPRAGG